MFIDRQLMFSDAQVLTATAASTDVLDLSVNRNLFDGEPMAIVITIDTGADNTTTDETYAIAVQTDDNAVFSSPATVSTTTFNNASGNITQLGLGKQVILPVPVGYTLERFLRLNYTLSGTTPSVTLTAFLQPLSMVGKVRYYADNSKITT